MDRRAAVRRAGCMRSQAGSSLLEVLIGGLLVALAVIALFQVLSQGSSLNHQAMVRRRAFQELDRTLAIPKYSSRSPYYIALTPGQLDSMNVTLDDRGDAGTANDLVGSMKVRVDTLSFTYSGTVIPAKRITAKVTYTDNGTTFQDSLQTFVTMTDVN
jgi:Tfp pilus assembly protein PilV